MYIGNTHFVYFDEIIFPFCFCSEKPVSFQNLHLFYFAVRNKTLWIITLFPKISRNVVLCSFCTYTDMYKYILYVLRIYGYSGSYSGEFCCQLHSDYFCFTYEAFLFLRHMKSKSKCRRAPHSTSQNLRKERRWKSLKPRRTALCLNPSTHSCLVIICLF